MDEQQQRIRENRMRCGPMASSIVSIKKKLGKGDYAVSLYSTLERAKEKLWRSESQRKDHPALACGPTLNNRGRSIEGVDGHILYYLYDYIDNNPCSDFTTIEEAKTDE